MAYRREYSRKEPLRLVDQYLPCGGGKTDYGTQFQSSEDAHIADGAVVVSGSQGKVIELSGNT